MRNAYAMVHTPGRGAEVHYLDNYRGNIAEAAANIARRARPRTGNRMMQLPNGSPGCATPGFKAGDRYPGWDAGCDPGCATDKALGQRAAAVGAGLPTTLTFNSVTAICVRRMVVITSGTAGFLITRFVINNSPQFIEGNSIHSAVYAPDAVGVGLSGDCLTVGGVATITATNLDVAAQDIDVALIGPSN